jgi:hypothetical protein
VKTLGSFWNKTALPLPWCTSRSIIAIFLQLSLNSFNTMLAATAISEKIQNPSCHIIVSICMK